MSAKATKWTVAGIALILSLAGSVIGASWGAGQYAAAVSNAQRAIADHENRIRTVEAQSQSTAADIRWIRLYLEKAAANGVQLDGNVN